MTTKTLTVALIGAGRWASKHHLPALLSDSTVRVVAIVDHDGDHAQAVALAAGVPASFSDVTAMLADVVPDAAIICTPHHTHAAIAHACMDAGVAVFVEKPLTVDPVEAEELTRKAVATGLQLSVGYTYHVTPAAHRVREWFASELGELLQVTAEFSSHAGKLYAAADPSDAASAYSAAAGSGQATTQLTHALAAIAHATADPFAEVAALTRNYDVPVDIDDAVLFRLHSGVTGTAVSTGWLPAGVPLRHRVVYLGRDAVIEHDLIGGTARCQRQDGSTLSVAPLHTEAAYPASGTVKEFLELVRTGALDRENTFLATHVVVAVAAVLRSAQERAFVRIEPSVEFPLSLST